jgi:hypothetical protein
VDSSGKTHAVATASNDQLIDLCWSVDPQGECFTDETTGKGVRLAIPSICDSMRLEDVKRRPTHRTSPRTQAARSRDHLQARVRDTSSSHHIPLVSQLKSEFLSMRHASYMKLCCGRRRHATTMVGRRPVGSCATTQRCQSARPGHPSVWPVRRRALRSWPASAPPAASPGPARSSPRNPTGAPEAPEWPRVEGSVKSDGYLAAGALVPQWKRRCRSGPVCVTVPLAESTRSAERDDGACAILEAKIHHVLQC